MRRPHLLFVALTLGVLVGCGGGTSTPGGNSDAGEVDAGSQPIDGGHEEQSRPPGAPTNVTAEYRHESALVSWTPPADDGGKPILRYVVTATPATSSLQKSGPLQQTVNAPATSVLFTGLTNGVQYTFTVVAQNEVGGGETSAPSPAVTPNPAAPEAPTNVAATAGISQATVSWSTPASDGGSAIIRYVVKSNPGSIEVNVEAPATTTTITNLQNGTPYTFTVTAVNELGSSPASASSAAVTPANLPGEPTDVSATRGDASATVTWVAPLSNGGSPITSYTVYASPGALEQTAQGGATSLDFSGLLNGVTYTFRVAATNGIGTSERSAPSNEVTPAGLPLAPTNVFAIPGEGTATVTWEAPGLNGGTLLNYLVTVSPTGTVLEALPPNQSITVTGLTKGSAYSFTVKTVTDVGASTSSVPSNTVVPASVPSAPTNVGAVAGIQSATVSWGAPVDNGGSAITGYTITVVETGATSTAAANATSVVIAGLSRQAHTFTVRATNAIGSSSPSAVSNAVTPTGVASAPREVTAAPLNNGAAVHWEAPLDNGGLQVMKYRVTATPGNVVAETTNGDTWLHVQGLTNGTAYTFVVQSLNDAGPGPASETSPVVIPAGPPLAPMITSAVRGDGQFTVSWIAPNNNGRPITGYRVWAFHGTTSMTSLDVNGTATTATVTQLSNGIPYTIFVAAMNEIGLGDLSLPSAAVTPAGVPALPQVAEFTPGDASIFVRWFDSPNDNGSPVIEYVVRTGTEIEVRVPFGTNSTTLTGLTNGTPYVVTVRAVNDVGESLSNALPAVTPSGKPGAPMNVQATPGMNQATITWTAPDANGSQLTRYRVTSNLGSSQEIFASANTQYEFRSLQNGTTYTFTVEAENSNGWGPVSAPSNAVTPAITPSAPQNVQGTARPNEATLTWETPVSDGGSPITSYTVSCVGACDASPATVGADVRSHTFTGLTNGTTYTFTVRAANAVGPSSDGAWVNLKPVNVPGAPTNVTAVRNDTRVTLTWTLPTDLGGGDIQDLIVTASPGGLVKSVGGKWTGFTFTGLTNGTAYTFTVQAKNEAGLGPASAPSNEVTPATSPAAPTNVTANAGDGKITLNWAAPADTGGLPLTSYSIRTSPVTPVQQLAPTATSYVISGLTNGTSYSVWLRTFNDLGSSPEVQVSARPVAPPSPPTPAVAAGVENGVRVSWTAPSENGGSNVTEYVVTLPSTGQTWNANATATTLLIENLATGPAKQYAFTVAARNAIGLSQPAQTNTMTLYCKKNVFTTVGPLTGITSASSIMTADMDLDGRIDIVVGDPGRNEIGVYRNLGNNSFAAITKFSAVVDANNTSAYLVALGDVTGDGIPDIVANSWFNGWITVFKGGNNLTYTAANVMPGGVGATPGGFLADLNGDGRKDLIVRQSGDSARGVSVLLSQGGGTFSSFTTYTMGPGQGIDLGDINGDGRLDLVSTSEEGSFQFMAVRLGNADGTFGTSRYVNNWSGIGQGLKLTDTNADGRLDAVVLNSITGKVATIPGDGAGSFSFLVSMDSSITPYAFQSEARRNVHVADFNRDGWPDIMNAATASSPAFNGMLLQYGFGTGLFSAPIPTTVAATPRGSVIADFNADGWPDTAVVTGANVAVLINSCQQ